MNHEISVVICVKNSEENLAQVIKTVNNENIGEIIIIDGLSNDKTVEIAKNFGCIVVSDEGKGLAEARNIGLKTASKKFVLFLGPDNELIKDSLSQLRNYLINSNYVGVGMLTKLKSITDYNSEGMNLRWQIRITEGEREVVGTPFMYYTHELRKYGFIGQAGLDFCDDAILGNRIALDGKKIGYSNVFCLELGQDGEEEIKNRFFMYGKSDYQFYVAHEKQWTEQRKEQSRRHGFKCEYDDVLEKIIDEKVRNKFEPFFKKIADYRVKGWIMAEQNDKSTNNLLR